MKKKIISIILILTFLSISTFVMLKTYSLLGFSAIGREILNPYLLMLAYGGIQLVILIESLVIVYAFARMVDKETLSSIGIQFNKDTAKFFIIGFILSILAAAITWLTFLIFHNPDYTAVHKSLQTYILIIILSIPAGIFQGTLEEILVRTWILKKLGKVFNPITAIILVGLIFGLLHLIFNSKYTILSSLDAAIMGWVASYAYFKTKSVWIPAGIHVGWNYFLGIVYGRSFFHVTLNGVIVSQFSGAEATVMGCITIIAIGIALHFILKGRKIEMW